MFIEFCPNDAILPVDPPNPITYDAEYIYDVLTIGGGISGTNAAYGAAMAGAKVCVLDKSDSMAFTEGASRRSAGKFVSRYSRAPQAMAKMLAEELIEQGETEESANLTARNMVAGIYHYLREGCDLFRQRENNFPLFRRSVKQGLLIVDRHLTAEKLKAQTQNKIEYGFTEPDFYCDDRDVAHKLGSPHHIFKSGYYDSIGGCFHPGQYMSALHEKCMRRGVDFFLGSDVIAISKNEGLYEVVCENGRRYRAKKIFAASAYSPEISPYVYSHTLPFYAHAVAISVGDRPNIMRNIGAFYDTNELAVYGQKRDGVLWLGRSDTVDNSQRVGRKRARRHVRIAKDIFGFTPEDPSHFWSGVYYQSPNELPILHLEDNGFWAAGGFGGYGNTLGQVVGENVGRLLAAEALGKLDPEAQRVVTFFSALPHRQRYDVTQQYADARLMLTEWRTCDQSHRRKTRSNPDNDKKKPPVQAMRRTRGFNRRMYIHGTNGAR